MKISAAQITQEHNHTVYRVSVESAKGDNTLWYSVHSRFGDLVSESLDAPCAALLIPAMASGEDIHLGGTVSERLFYNLSGPLQSVLRHVMPALRPVKICAKDVHGGKPRAASGVATGFSGGIDSYCVLADHHYSSVSDGFRVTHLLFNNVGSHGEGSRGEKLFQERYRRLLPAADVLGLPFLMVNSNVDAFYGGQLDFLQTHTLRNTSVALLLQEGIGRYLYASSHEYAAAFVGPANAMGYTDSITLPLLSTKTLDAFSTGSEYTRVEKTLRVAQIPDSYGTLDVCAEDKNTSGYTNCSACFKCLRTLATLEIAGYLERYSQVFDLEIYKRHRIGFFTELLQSQEPLLREIAQFAKERDFPFPRSSRVAAVPGIGWLAMLSMRVMRKLKQTMARPI